jgi:hypothetical protein
MPYIYPNSIVFIYIYDERRDHTGHTKARLDIQDFFVTMRVTADDTVAIVAQDTEAMQEYRLLIDLAFIKGHDSLRLFDEPFDVFDYLYHHSADVVVSQGLIEFEYTTGNLRKKAKKVALELATV